MDNILDKYFDKSGKEPTPIVNVYSVKELESLYSDLEDEASVQAPRLNGVSLQRLRSFDGSDGIPSGGYWANHVSCLVTNLELPKSGHPRKATRICPAVLAPWSLDWKNHKVQARLGIHHISWRLKNGGQGRSDHQREYILCAPRNVREGHSGGTG